MDSQKDWPALNVVSAYTTALAAGDAAKMNTFRAPDFELDWVYRDAFQDQRHSVEEATAFWASWFAGFGEIDYQVTRTIAAETVVVTQWTFTGANTGALDPPAFRRHIEPSGKTIRLRGISVYDIQKGLVQRETIYMDLATLMVEMGIVL